MKKQQKRPGKVLDKMQMKQLSGGIGILRLWECWHNGTQIIQCYLYPGITPQEDCGYDGGCTQIGTCQRSSFCAN